MLIGLSLAVSAWFFFGRSSGPKYQGKSIGYWFEEYCQPSENRARRDQLKALEALRQMGTNAVSYLLDQAMNPARDTALRTNLHQLLRGSPRSWGLPSFVSREEIRKRAVQAIWEIKPPASLILPRLLKSLSERDTPEYGRAITILTRTGEGRETLVPYFARALHATNRQTRLEAVFFFDELGPKAAPAVPDLIGVLQTSERTNALYLRAALTLGRMGSNAAPAIPLLLESYASETNLPRRLFLAAVLCMIDPHQAEPFGLLVGTLTNQQSSADQVRWAASRLGSIGKNAGAAIPALLEAANGTNVGVWRTVLESLDKIGAPADLVLPKSRVRLKSKDEAFQVAAARRILAISPSDAEAQSVMLSQITNHSKSEREAIIWLGGAGTNAQATAPLLLEAFNGTNLFAWMEVPEALKKMGVSPQACLPKLRDKLRSTDEHVRASSAELILAIEPGHQAAQIVLMDLIKAKSKCRWMAIETLGEAGPPAKSALPLLRQELKSKDSDIREAAAEAIERIESKNPAGSGEH